MQYHSFPFSWFKVVKFFDINVFSTNFFLNTNSGILKKNHNINILLGFKCTKSIGTQYISYTSSECYPKKNSLPLLHAKF